MIYLDHNATTPVCPQAREAMAPFFGAWFGNPSSPYPLGRRAKACLESARERVAKALGALPEEIVFTSGGTESDNMAVFGGVAALKKKGGHVITTAIEHPAVTSPALFLLNNGHDVTFVPVDSLGLVDPDQIQAAIRPDTVLISVMHANNETGVLQPVEKIAALAKKAGALFHTDAAQSVGKVPVDVAEMGVDLLTVAGHKLYAPKGVGVLYIRKGAPVAPLLHGGGQENGMRPGTENVALASGLAAALETVTAGLEADAQRMQYLRDRLFGLLQEKVPGILLNGHPEKRLPNTLNVSFPGVNGEDILAASPDLCASTGAACHGGSTRVSHVLAAMRLPMDRARGAVRLSLGRRTTAREVEKAAGILARAYFGLTP